VRAFVEPEITETVASVAASGYEYEPPVLNDAFEETQKIEVHEVVAQPEPQPVEPVVQATSIDVNSIPPEVIDQIARRAVEMLSAKVVQEIAWEVVPDLAELMIKRQLEEHESQTK
jgi:hypothetical protein